MTAKNRQPSVHPVTCYGNRGNKEVLSAIPAGAKKILDLGCGAGDLARTGQREGMVWDGVTISPEEAARSKPYYRRVMLHDLEEGLPKTELDADYDVCICSHVIEHLIWPAKMLNDIRTVLAGANGTLIVAVPNAVNHEVRFKIARGKFDYRSSGILDINHVRWYTFASARRLLEENGFTVVRSWASGNFPIGKRLRRKIPVSWMERVDRLSCAWFPGFFGFQLMYAARPSVPDADRSG